MFQIGDLVVYGGEGVCRVLDIGIPDIPGLEFDSPYYTLKPLYRDGKTFTPVNTNVFMRAVISKEEAQDLIRQIPEIDPDPFVESNLRLLSEHYEETIQAYDCAGLIRLIQAVYSKGVTAVENRKKLGQIDERYRRRAEDLLHGELAVALDIPKDNVKDYIEESVQEQDRQRSAG